MRGSKIKKTRKVSPGGVSGMAGDLSRFQAFELVQQPRSALKNAPYNPRAIGQAERARLREGIEAHGIVEPPVWNRRTGHLVGFHQRLSILDDLHGGKDYRLTVAQIDVDPRAERKLNLLLNNPKAQGTWDDAKLAKVLQDLDRDLAGSGFDAQDLEQLLAQLGQPSAVDAAPQLDRAEQLRKKWKVEPGQLWQLGEHKLLCGDATKPESFDKLLGKETPAAVLTDPPYGQNQNGVPNDEPENLNGIIEPTVKNCAFDNCIFIAFQSPRTFPVWLDAIRLNGHHVERMLWLYKAAQCAKPWRGWILTSESILVSSRGKPQWQESKPYAHDCYNLSEVSGELNGDLGWHGSVKPIKVVADLLSRISKKESVVLDPFLGSGTTLIACEQLGRRCRAMEISPAYVAVALQRWADATGKKPEMLKS